MRLDRGCIRLGFMLLAIVGCSDERMASNRNYEPAEGSAPPASPAFSPQARVSSDVKVTKSPTAPGAGDKATAGRKIIYQARIDLVTEDLSALDAKLARLIERSRGYVADSMVSGKAGNQRAGTWKVRVPVDGYDSFLKEATALGELVSLKADAQDVSEEYFDLEARLKNKKVEEARLLKLLTDATGKLEEVLKVEHELSRVRDEIERFEGRLRALANLTTLTTVTISAREVQDYVPPQAPTFSTRIARTFESSVDSLRQFGEGFVLFLVGLAPWLPLIVLVAVTVLIVGRRIMPRR